MLNRRVWTRQPQVAVGVDWSNPLTRGLIVASSPGLFGGRNAVDGGRLVVQTATASKVTKFGVALDQQAGANSAYFPANIPSGTTTYTLITIAGALFLDKRFAIALGDEVSGGSAQARLVLNGVQSGGTLLGKLAFIEYGGGFHVQVETSAATYVDPVDPPNPHIYGVVRNGADAAIWFDGSKVASNSSASGSSTFAQRVYVSGSGYSNTVYLDQSVAAFAWLRALTDKEIVSVMGNPWQLFAPLSRPVFAPSAASAFPVLSNPTMTSLTSTTGYPRVDVTW